MTLTRYGGCPLHPRLGQKGFNGTPSWHVKGIRLREPPMRSGAACRLSGVLRWLAKLEVMAEQFQASGLTLED